MRKRRDLNEQYATGQTKPPKSYGGLIAILLILVIFLSGIISILGMMNIELLRIVKDSNAENIPMLETASLHQPKTAMEPQNDQCQWGMNCHAVTDFHARYYHIPQGIYVADVDTGCFLAQQGVRSGDIITHFNDTAVCDIQALTEMIQLLPQGEKAVFKLMRKDTPITLTITLNEEFYGTDLS